jgi:hypothetical protein
MRWPWVSRKTYDRACTEITELRIRIVRTETRHDKVEGARRRLAGQYTALEERYTAVVIVNDCLTEDLAAARQQLTDGAVAELQARAVAAEHPADQLQSRLDDALGLNSSAVLDGRHWQQTRHDKKGVAL